MEDQSNRSGRNNWTVFLLFRGTLRLLLSIAQLRLYCSFRNRRVDSMQFGLDGKGDSMQSGQRECSNWPVKKSIGLDGRTMNNHSCLPLLPQAITNLLVRTICVFYPRTPLSHRETKTSKRWVLYKQQKDSYDLKRFARASFIESLRYTSRNNNLRNILRFPKCHG